MPSINKMRERRPLAYPRLAERYDAGTGCNVRFKQELLPKPDAGLTPLPAPISTPIVTISGMECKKIHENFDFCVEKWRFRERKAQPQVETYDCEKRSLKR